jgi:shikimate kinase
MQSRNFETMANLYLIGYRGCGKSSVAPLVGEQLGWKVVDSDQVIQDQAGTTIAEIFAEQGEPAFRALEQAAIGKIAQTSNQVISLGGGAPMFEANRNVISATGKTVYLSAPADVLWSRIRQDAVSDTQRPDLTDEGGLTEVKSMLAVRDSVYAACADCTIECGSLTVQEVADQILEWWQTVDKTL